MTVNPAVRPSWKNGWVVLGGAVLSIASVGIPVAQEESCSDPYMVAMEIDGLLYPTAATFEQVTADLAMIRAHFTYMEQIHYWFEWVPRMMALGMTPEAYDAIVAGTYTGLDSLNALYHVVSIVPWLHVHHYARAYTDRCYDMVMLAAIYEQHPDVLNGEANYYIQGDGNDIIPNGVGHYTFREAWGDCAQGCEYEHFWVFTVTDGQVVLVDEYGDPVEGWETAMPESPSGIEGGLLCSAHPNPFNPETALSLLLPTASMVQVRISDPSGRLVRHLLNREFRPAGAVRLVWDGRDDAGRPLPGGVYLYAVEAGGHSASGKLTLLK